MNAEGPFKDREAVGSAGNAPWAARVITLFPEMFPGPLGLSLAGRALAGGLWTLETVNPRDFALDKHRRVDDTPAGGGPGMVLRPDVMAAAVDHVRADRTAARQPVICLSPRGQRIDQAFVRALARGGGVTLICGRFEGIDERVIEARDITEASIGDFVLSGGEPAAIAVIDATLRLLPGVMGAPAGLDEESFEGGLLEYPQYTRPRVWEEMAVPDVLLSGHHANISAWRRRRAEAITKERRPDLWDRYAAASKEYEG